MQNRTYAKEELVRQLEQLNCPSGKIVLLHTSYRLVGSVDGGPQGLLDVLVDYFTRDGGLLCIPAHTWHNLGKEITLDMGSDDTCVGVLSRLALQDRRGIRSENPTHSMVVFGDRARALELIKDEPELIYPTGPQSCYGKICTEGGYVLLIGVTHNRSTCLHAAEEILGIPNRMAKKPCFATVRRLSGDVVCREIYMHDNDKNVEISTRYVKYDTPFRYHGCITDGFLGNAPVQLCDARKMMDTMALIAKNSNGKDPLLCDEKPIPQKWYCIKQFIEKPRR